MKKISIIGGSGFIGQNLANTFLKNNYSFEILDLVQSKGFETKYNFFDVTSLDGKEKVTGEIIINLSAEHKDDVKPASRYYEVNEKGAENICRIAEAKNITTIVFTSSVAVYGFASPKTGEDGDIKPFNDYGKSKAKAEKVYQDWYQRDPENRKLIIIRPTAVFGKNNRGNIYNLFNQINSGFFTMIGSGKNIKSIAYVENLVDFITFSLNLNNGYHLYNFIDKPDLDMNNLVKLIKEILNKQDILTIKIPYFLAYLIGKVADLISFVTRTSFPISSIRVEKFCKNTQFDTAVTSSGFEPKITLNEAIKITLKEEFFDKAKDKLKR
jgi:nucleoside-diphosphate-sugar epimerase